MFYRKYKGWRAKWGWLQQVQQAEAERGRQGSVSGSVNKNKNKKPEFPFGCSGQGKGGGEGEEAGGKQCPSSTRRQAKKKMGERRGRTGTKRERGESRQGRKETSAPHSIRAMNAGGAGMD